jgi:SAM-dependent methyltransferase
MRADEYQAMHDLELNHWWFRSRRRILLDLVGQLAGAQPGLLRILDVGCGTGGNTGAYASFGWVIGIEPDSTAARLAQRRGGAVYCRSSAGRLPFRNQTFDVAVASDVIEHIEDDAGAVAEIARVLRRGGSAVFTVPAHPWLFSEHDAALHHFRRYSRAALKEVLLENGLRLRKISYWNTSLFPVFCLYRLLHRRLGSASPQSDTTPAPRLINEVLTGLLGAEAAILRRGSLPWGLSLLSVAERV